MKKGFITLHVNGDTHEVQVSSQHTLLDVLRGKLKLMGTKEGCTTGSCGVCTVNNGRGEAVLSCLTPALEWDGQSITTIEGLENERLSCPHPAGLRRVPRRPVRLLHPRRDHVRPGCPERQRRRPPRTTSTMAWPACSVAAPGTSR